VRIGDQQSFVIADIPGLIEGAAEGAGLGHQFLRHLSRTGLLLHIVDCCPTDGGDPVRDIRAIISELRKFDERLHRKPRWLVLNKADLVAPEDRPKVIADLRRRLRTTAPIYMVSAATGEGCEGLMRAIAEFLEQRARVPARARASVEEA
jgi:GTP-binding protein